MPGEGKRCSKSRKIGHFAAVCRSVRKVTSDLGEILSNFSLELLTRLTSYEKPRSVELHTRADISGISVSVYQALPELPRPLHLLALSLSPTLATSSANLPVFSCRSLNVDDSSAMSCAKSGSSSTVVKLHLIPLLLSAVPSS